MLRYSRPSSPSCHRVCLSFLRCPSPVCGLGRDEIGRFRPLTDACSFVPHPTHTCPHPHQQSTRLQIALCIDTTNTVVTKDGEPLSTADSVFAAAAINTFHTHTQTLILLLVRTSSAAMIAAALINDAVIEWTYVSEDLREEVHRYPVQPSASIRVQKK